MCKCERVWDYAREWKFQINMFHTFLRWLAVIGGPFGSGMVKVLKVEVQLFLPVRIKTVSLHVVFVVYIYIVYYWAFIFQLIELGVRNFAWIHQLLRCAYQGVEKSYFSSNLLIFIVVFFLIIKWKPDSVFITSSYLSRTMWLGASIVLRVQQAATDRMTLETEMTVLFFVDKDSIFWCWWKIQITVNYSSEFGGANPSC